ncbi:hypothetical protein GJ496_008006, partial [Pomphorhynchus laevis]
AEELLKARNKPVLKSNYASQPPRYPFVFDLQAERMQASFSGLKGNQFVLPENAKKISRPGYTRVHLPALTELDSVQPIPEYTPVFIDSLDNIGQMIFANIDYLNRIQSIVYPSAYNTNENLLICAPTGAGKTNVALLAVASEIRRNIVNNQLDKDNFKIVYVAPMKALAAEMTESFGKRLACLDICVRELTGDMQLTKRQIASTQMIITTPEKWDVITRKGTADDQLIKNVKLLIIDEIHLLQDDRGPVIECIVARTLRYVEQLQSPIRIIGLSATLPNYIDVSQFLRVNPYTGLFFFDSRFRPVPLAQTFVGVSGSNRFQTIQNMDSACYDEVKGDVRKENQVLVFVHARNATTKTAEMLLEKSRRDESFKGFISSKAIDRRNYSHFKNEKLSYFVENGIGVHHAGMARSDRNIIEDLFKRGIITVLVCTATLAWGVNLPAHSVVIKGTSIYDSKRSAFVDIGILDVLQIFGRAGRPQFDTSGHGIIITTEDKVSYYLALITRQHPIESNLISSIVDSLNAEIALGTVTTVEEGMRWLEDTYLYVRLKINPLAYGLREQDVRDNNALSQYRRVLICETAKRLDSCYMIRFDERTEYLKSTDLGRVASHFYITFATVAKINQLLSPSMNEGDILNLVSNASEFDQIKVYENNRKF